MQPVEQLGRVAAGAEVERELRVVGIGEAVQARQVEHPCHECGGDVEHATPADRGELRTVPDEGERRARFVRDGEERQGGVLVEHPRLVHHDPLARHELSALRWAAVGRARLRVRVAHGEARPDAIGVPSEPVVVDECGYGVGWYAELAGGDVGGLLRRRHHPHAPAVALGGADRRAEHGGLARAGRALDHDQRPGRGDRGRRSRLVRIQPRLAHDRGCARCARGGACSESVAQLRLDGDDVERRQVRHRHRGRYAGREDREAVVRRQPRRDPDELAQLVWGRAYPGLGDDARHLLLHVMHRPRRCSDGGAVECAGRDLLHGQLAQRARGLHGGARQVRRIAGVLQLAQPAGLEAERARLLVRALLIPCLRLQPGPHHRPRLLAGMRRLPLRHELVEVARHLSAAFRHEHVPGLQLHNLAGHRIEGEPVHVEHGSELRVRGQDRGAERADRTLLPEQRRRVQTPPGTGSPNPRADLEVDVPVRITRPARLVGDGDRLQLLD